jgi:DNA-binding SARP family transcriptional activator
MGHLFENPSFAQLRIAQPHRGEDSAGFEDFVADIWKREESRVLIVFENAEQLASPEFDRSFLQRLLAETPRERCVMFCSRGPLPFSLSRFAPPHQVALIGPSELSFEQHELEALFAGIGAEPADLLRVRELSRGWAIAALLLRRFAAEGRLADALGRLQHSGFDDMFAFLQDEVLSRLEPESLDVLVRIAAIPDATLTDLQAAFGAPITHDGLRAIVRALPFVQLHSDRVEIHPLLRETLAQEQASRMRAILLETAVAHRHGGEFVRSAQLFAFAGDFERAASALSALPPYMFSHSLPACADVVDQLDGDIICRYPSLWAATVPLRCYALDSRRYAREAAQMWFSLSNDEDPEVRSTILMAYCATLAEFGQMGECEEAVTAEIARLNGTSPALACALMAHLAGRYGVRGAFEKARQCLAAVGQHPELAYLRGRALDNIQAHEAFINGRYVEGMALMEHALRLARHSGAAIATTTTLANAAFFSWLYGDDEKTQTLVDQLEAEMLPGLERGFAEFISGVRGKWSATAPSNSVPVYRACAALFACGNGTLQNRREAADEAVRASREARDPYMTALALVARATLDPKHEARDRVDAVAESLSIDSKAFQSAISSVSGSDTPELLGAFIRRLNARESQPDQLLIEVFEGRVRRDGSICRLTEFELTLTAILAVERTAVRREVLTDHLWPEVDPFDARNNLKVAIHRIRQKLGANAVLLEERGYRLSPTAAIDLEEATDVLSLPRQDALTESARTKLLHYTQSLKSFRTYEKAPEWFAEKERWFAHLYREGCVRLAFDALQRGNTRDALDFSSALRARDQCDEEACEIALRAHLQNGDRAAALDALRSYATALQRELGVEPSIALVRLVSEAQGAAPVRYPRNSTRQALLSRRL